MPPEEYLELMHEYWSRDEAMRIARLFDYPLDNYWDNQENIYHKRRYVKEARKANHRALRIRGRYAQ